MSPYKRTILSLIGICLALLLVAGCRGSGRSSSATEQSGSVTAVAAGKQATATSRPTERPTQTATAMPKPTETPSPTETPNPTATSSPTAVPSPTVTPSPTAAPTEPPPEWLNYVNQFRSIAGLPLFVENEAYTMGSDHHSRYMVVNDDAIAHSENKNNPLYTPAGDQAGQNGNLFATSQLDADYRWSANFWASAPFHVIGMLDPRLKEIGYGDHVEDVGETKMAAVMDIRSDPRGAAGDVDYPIYFPGDGSETWIVRHSMIEWPDTFGSCPGYKRPSGPAIVILLGDGSLRPRVYSHTFWRGQQELESCLFDETSYRTANAFEQETGRRILDMNDAIVIMPREPLEGGQTYTVQVIAEGGNHIWSFTTGPSPD